MSGNNRLLITGGLGNAGLWITEHFVNAGFKVTVLTRKSKGLSIEQQVDLIEADISDLTSTQSALEHTAFDTVIHLASVNETFLENYPEIALKVNTWGTRNLLQSIDKAALKNFIYFSTFHVYGQSHGVIDESTQVLPRHDYATTHYFAETYVKQFHQTHQLPYTILRLTNGYGAPKDVDSSKWYLILNDLAKMAYQQQRIQLKSNGRAFRDFIWLGDVCKVVSQVAQLPQAPNAVFNLGTGQAKSLLDIAKQVQKAYQDKFGQLIPIEVNTNDQTEAKSLIVNCNKLQKLVAHRPQEKIYEEALAVFDLLQAQTS